MTEQSTPDAFVEIAGNPPPPSLTAKLVTCSDGVELRCAISKPNGPIYGTVLLLQGRNETIEKYFETMSDLNARGFMVTTFDWRGQGASAARRPKANEKQWAPPTSGRRLGHVRGMKGYLLDLETVVKELLLPDCRPPYAVLAHSMGGLVALCAADKLANRIERMILTAPLVALPRSWIPTGLLRFGAWTARLLGFGRLPVKRGALPGAVGTPANNPLTSDLRRFERNKRLATTYPGLFLSAPTFGWVASITSAMKKFERSDVIARHAIPTLFICAGSDRVVSTAAAERLAWRMRTGSSVTLPEARHELLQEKDRYREPLFAAIETFLGPSMSVPSTAGPAPVAPKPLRKEAIKLPKATMPMLVDRESTHQRDDTAS